MKALFVSTWDDIYYPLADSNTAKLTKCSQDKMQLHILLLLGSLTTHTHVGDSRHVTYTAGSPSWANQPYGILDSYARGTQNHRISGWK